MKRVRIEFNRRDLSPVEFKNIRMSIGWLKEHGHRVYKARNFSDYFNRHPDRVVYPPTHGDYIVRKLDD